MDPRDDWPALGRLIEEARDRLKISQNEVASRVEMTGTRWRQIVKGDADLMHSIRGLRTLAKMAEVVGLSPQQVGEVGRADVAAEMRPSGHAEETHEDDEKRRTLPAVLREAAEDQELTADERELSDNGGDKRNTA